MTSDHPEVIVFVGPTIDTTEAAEILPAVFRPPVGLGDVYLAASRRPLAIGVIDGYFERTPAVWHKEILWALSQGIHVFGSSSMGALRAAELERYGMVGVGAIFNAYRGLSMTADDEVAVAHAGVDERYRPLSEALVNIRATMAAAVDLGVTEPAVAAAVVDAARGHFYADRTWPGVLASASEVLGVDVVDELEPWCRANAVDQKREDAVLLLEELAALQAGPRRLHRAAFDFPRSFHWEEARTEFDTGSRPEEPRSRGVDDVLDELRLDPRDYRRVHEAALVRYLAQRLADWHDMAPTRSGAQEAADRFRFDRGLLEPSDVSEWLGQNQISEADLERLVLVEARHAWVREVARGSLRELLVDELRLSGRYETLAQRAAEKRSWLEDRGLGDPDVDLAGGSVVVQQWFLRRAAAETSSAAVETLVEELGFEDTDHLIELATRHILYSESAAGGA